MVATQVWSSLARRLGIDIGALPPTDHHVEGIVEVMLDATHKYQASFTIERLFGWHFALFPTGRSGMTKIVVGDWRDDSTGPMQVVADLYGRGKGRFCERAAALALNERQIKVLNRLLDGFEGKMTSSKWALIAKCSQDTANRDIAALLDHGLLQKSEGGGHSTPYEPVLQALWHHTCSRVHSCLS
ncbi:MAG: hypothetical protein ACK5IP_11085 [Paracoccus sp. (in: a-proteobacteria)]